MQKNNPPVKRALFFQARLFPLPERPLFYIEKNFSIHFAMYFTIVFSLITNTVARKAYVVQYKAYFMDLSTKLYKIHKNQ